MHIHYICIFITSHLCKKWQWLLILSIKSILSLTQWRDLTLLPFSFKHFLLQMPIVFNPPYYLNLQSKVNMLIHSVHSMKDFFVKHFLVRNLQITTFQVSTACWFFEVDPWHRGLKGHDGQFSLMSPWGCSSFGKQNFFISNTWFHPLTLCQRVEKTLEKVSLKLTNIYKRFAQTSS